MLQRCSSQYLPLHLRGLPWCHAQTIAQREKKSYSQPATYMRNPSFQRTAAAARARYLSMTAVVDACARPPPQQEMLVAAPLMLLVAAAAAAAAAAAVDAARPPPPQHQTSLPPLMLMTLMLMASPSSAADACAAVQREMWLPLMLIAAAEEEGRFSSNRPDTIRDHNFGDTAIRNEGRGEEDPSYRQVRDVGGDGWECGDLRLLQR